MKLTSPYLNGQIYHFKRKAHQAVTLVMNAVATESTGSFTFKLSDVPNVTEFTSLFDKYRITGIRAEWIPRTNVLAINNLSSSLTSIPPLITVVDYDDATAQSYNELFQYENAKVHNEFKPFKLYFKPMVAVATYQGTFTGYGSSRKMWLDCASDDIEYYSLKWASLPYSAGNNPTVDPSWDIVFTYYMQFKYPR